MRKIRLTSLALMTMLIMVGVNLTSCSKKDTPEEEEKKSITQDIGKGVYKATFVSKEGQVSHYSGEGLGKVRQVQLDITGDEEFSGKASNFVAFIINDKIPFMINGLLKVASHPLLLPQTEKFLDEIEKLKEGESLENYTISERGGGRFLLNEGNLKPIFSHNITLTMKKVTFLGSKKVTDDNGQEMTFRAYAIKGKIKGENDFRFDEKSVDSAEVEFEIVDDMNFEQMKEFEIK